jgi:predicted enzyme related to lactoylglutathione lyase
MISTDGVYIELAAKDPERLAAFYERLVGVTRLDTGGSGVLLGGRGVLLRIKPALDEPADGGAVFGFELPPDADLAACRAEAVAAGAVVLSESKRGPARLLACQDPAGNEFVLAIRAAIVPEAPPRDALVPVDQVPRAAEPPTATARHAAPRPTVTRRELDRLRDVERLAAMQEAIAGLDVPFSTSDPAAVLSDMKQKLGSVPSIDSEALRADEELRARERQAAAEELLARYRAQIAPPEPEPPKPEPPEPAASVETPVADEPDAIAAPRTLGRSTLADDED